MLHLGRNTLAKCVVYVATSNQNIDYAKWGNIVLRSIHDNITEDVDYRWYTNDAETVPCVIDEFPVEIIELPKHDLEGLDGDQAFALPAFSLCPDSLEHAAREGKYERAIYFDLDMVACGNLDELVTCDLEGKPMASNMDWHKDFGMDGHYDYWRNLDHPDASEKFIALLKSVPMTFNAGLVVADCAEWRKLNLPDFRMWCDLYYQRYCDQEFLNIMINGNFKVISNAYNIRTWTHLNHMETEEDFIRELTRHHTEDRRIVQYLYEQKYFHYQFERVKKEMQIGVPLHRLGQGIFCADFSLLIKYLKDDERLLGQMCNAEHLELLENIIEMRDKKYAEHIRHATNS
ncbi:hypothetical protein VPHK567_0311 [Vibrio phage K567]